MHLDNNAKCDVVGVGNVRIRIYYDIVRILTRVRYVLKLKKNLIFLSVLDLARY